MTIEKMKVVNCVFYGDHLTSYGVRYYQTLYKQRQKKGKEILKMLSTCNEGHDIVPLIMSYLHYSLTQDLLIDFQNFYFSPLNPYNLGAQLSSCVDPWPVSRFHNCRFTGYYVPSNYNNRTKIPKTFLREIWNYSELSEYDTKLIWRYRIFPQLIVITKLKRQDIDFYYVT